MALRHHRDDDYDYDYDYGDFDDASQLDRSGVYRFNIGVGRKTFQELFDTPAAVTSAGFAAISGTCQ